MSFAAASKQWEHNRNGNRVRNETSEPVSALGDWWSRMERRVWQLGREVTQPPETIDTMARMVEAHAAREAAHWLGMREQLAERDTKWDERHTDNVLQGMGIADITGEVLATARVRAVAPAQEVRTEG